MKRLLHIQFLLVLLLALGYSPLQAKRITQWQAQQQAYSFWGKQMPQKAKAKSRTATTASPSDAYYVFNNDAGGFVIIAGDDAVTPVLGYTSTGAFDAENLPDGLKDLLKSYERQIAALGDNYVANQTATRAAFTGEKLLKTAEWNQMAPFNKYTPNNYVTGCVATAGAIVMKHHGYPAKGIGNHSYTWKGKTLTANFEHDYDWASMPAKYDGTNDADFDGVARLMSDLGVAVEMQYAKSGSGAYIGDMISALQTYFGYSKLTYLASIDDMEAEAWNAKLRGEIDKRDFDELASHYFKSIDLSGAKVVAYEGYKADMVPKYAFEGNEYLEHFKMPAGVKELGFNAFRATNLKEIDLPETIEEFGRNTFYACFKLTDVYMRHKEAPYWISWCVFANKSSRLYRTLHLYPGSKAKYEAHSYTQNWIVYFDNVVEDLEPTGIHSVTLDKETGNKAIYDLNGRRIQNVPSWGIYIQNGKKMIRK